MCWCSRVHGHNYVDNWRRRTQWRRGIWKSYEHTKQIHFATLRVFFFLVFSIIIEDYFPVSFVFPLCMLKFTRKNQSLQGTHQMLLHGNLLISNLSNTCSSSLFKCTESCVFAAYYFKPMAEKERFQATATAKVIFLPEEWAMQ